MIPYTMNFDNFLNKTDMDTLSIFSQMSKIIKESKDWKLNEDGYLILKSFKEDEIKNDEYDFSYRINKHGYRANNFKEFDDNKIKILFSGCSHTFGEGLPEELIWPSIVDKRIGDNTDSYNLGISGASIHLVIKNVYSFIRNYGKPDHIFLMLPAISRSIKYDKDAGLYKNILAHSHKKYKKFLKNFVYEDNVLLATTLIFMLEDYCLESNIKLHWSTWSNEDLPIYDKLNFNNYLYFDSDSVNTDIENGIMDNTAKIPYWKIARDNSHMGSGWQLCVANAFMNKIEKDV
jgi:hypothetical protein